MRQPVLLIVQSRHLPLTSFRDEALFSGRSGEICQLQAQHLMNWIETAVCKNEAATLLPNRFLLSSKWRLIAIYNYSIHDLFTKTPLLIPEYGQYIYSFLCLSYNLYYYSHSILGNLSMMFCLDFTGISLSIFVIFALYIPVRQNIVLKMYASPFIFNRDSLD